ncbi:hypothetical protein BH09BAC1_BH09BAC1_19630 [soil metagenome]
MLYLLALVIFLTGCTSINKSYTGSYMEEKKLFDVKYHVEVPKDFRNHIVVTGGWEDEHQYWYGDSAMFFYTRSASNSFALITYVPDIDNISSALFTASVNNDTLNLSGITNNGLYWRVRKLHAIQVGYVNVREGDLVKFGSALESVIAKRVKRQ